MLDFILEFFFPTVCGFCGNFSKNGLCKDCEENLSSKFVCETRNVKEHYFEEHIYVLRYDEDVRQKILGYKFDGRAYMYKTFSTIILNSKKICDILKSYDIIIPVPIHKMRKKERGYNQSALIAKELAKNIDNLQYIEGLKKIKNNPKQSLLDKKSRIQNVKNAYEVINCEKIQNKRVVLFDDIYTTGSTVNECSRVLKQNGANYILVLTLAD